MNADELQELIKKLLAKGVTVLVLVIGPAGQLMGVEPGDTAGPPAVGAEPNQSSTVPGAGPGTTPTVPDTGTRANPASPGPSTGAGATPGTPSTGTTLPSTGTTPPSTGTTPPSIGTTPGTPSTGTGTTPLPDAGQQDPPASGGTRTPDSGAATPRAGGVATVPPTGTWSNPNQGARPPTGTGQNGTGAGGPGTGGIGTGGTGIGGTGTGTGGTGTGGTGGSGAGTGGTGSGGGDVGDTRSGDEAGGSTGDGSGGAGSGDGGAGQAAPGPGRPGTGQRNPDTGGAGTGGDTGTRSGKDGGSGDDAGGAGGGTDAGSGNGTRNGTGAPATGPGGGAGVSGAQGTTAAEAFGWGNAVRADDFTGGTEGWSIYDGPGHAGNGRRTPDAVSISDGVLTITGDAEGNTAGMAWNPGQKYGRWEGRVKAPAADPSYNALLLLWPDAENFPEGGEVDFMEMMDPSRQKTNLFLHYGADNSQVSGDVEIDATQWHNWAVEWTPDHIAAFVDGEQWWKTTDTSILPPGPMHLCIQLDWFPKGDGAKESTMQVDWVKQYALDGSSSGGTGREPTGTEGRAGAGEPAAGGKQGGGEQAGAENRGGG